MKHDRGKATPAPRDGIETREHPFDHIVMLTTRSIPFALTVVPRFLYLLPPPTTFTVFVAWRWPGTGALTVVTSEAHRICGKGKSSRPIFHRGTYDVGGVYVWCA